MRAFLMAIVSALRGAFAGAAHIFDWILLSPFRLAGGIVQALTGGGGAAPAQSTERPDPRSALRRAAENAAAAQIPPPPGGYPPGFKPSSAATTTAADRAAGTVFSYSLAVAMDGRRLAMPRAIPPQLRDWLPGLTHAQFETLAEAGPARILAHISGEKLVPGVCAVQRLDDVPLDVSETSKYYKPGSQMGNVFDGLASHEHEQAISFGPRV